MIGTAMQQENRKRIFMLGSISMLIALVLTAVLASINGQARKHIAAPQQLVGRIAPPISLPLHSGGMFDLSGERGHVVVLDFWATWCGPCVEAMPVTDEIIARYADRGVKIVAISVDDPATLITDFKSKVDVNAPVALAANTDVPADYGIATLPTLVIIDANGVVRDAGSMLADDIRTWLPAALDKVVPAATPSAAAPAAGEDTGARGDAAK